MLLFEAFKALADTKACRRCILLLSEGVTTYFRRAKASERRKFAKRRTTEASGELLRAFAVAKRQQEAISPKLSRKSKIFI